MSHQNVGYIRVSSVGQNTARQLVGVELDEVFEEKVSGKDANRPKLQECMKHCRKGDTLHVHSIDRLARNLWDLKKIVEELKAKGVTVRFHKEALTFKPGEHDPMHELMFKMLGAFAEFERDLIRERQREGIAAAKEAGKQIGAKPKLTDQDIERARQLLDEGQSKKEVAQVLGVSRQTLYTALAR